MNIKNYEPCEVLRITFSFLSFHFYWYNIMCNIHSEKNYCTHLYFWVQKIKNIFELNIFSCKIQNKNKIN